MKTWGFALVAAALAHVAQADLDCGRPATARNLLGRAMLAEIESAEDLNREAMWEAFGRCGGQPAAEACREAERRRFTVEFERRKAAIEAQYKHLLEDFQARCQASVT